jgi:hypothetical protein
MKCFRKFLENISIGNNGLVVISDPNLIGEKTWKKINDYMVSKGYDWRGAQDAKNIITHMLGKSSWINLITRHQIKYNPLPCNYWSSQNAF